MPPHQVLDSNPTANWPGPSYFPKPTIHPQGRHLPSSL